MALITIAECSQLLRLWISWRLEIEIIFGEITRQIINFSISFEFDVSELDVRICDGVLQYRIQITAEQFDSLCAEVALFVYEGEVEFAITLSDFKGQVGVLIERGAGWRQADCRPLSSLPCRELFEDIPDIQDWVWPAVF